MTLDEYFDFFNQTSHELLKDLKAASVDQSTNLTRIITGDGTPMDLWDFRHWRHIPQNFGKTVPTVLTPHLVKYIHGEHTPKMLIQLREPVERLYSDYIFLHQGKNVTTFHTHVVKAIGMMRKCLENKNMSKRLCFFDMDLYKKLPTRIHLGCYSVFLKEWLQVFPMSSFHVTRTEDYKLNMKDTLRDIFSFLKLKPLSVTDLKGIVSKDRKHITGGKKGKILPQTFRILKDFYRPCLQETASLLNDKRFLWEDVYSSKQHSNDEKILK